MSILKKILEFIVTFSGEINEIGLSVKNEEKYDKYLEELFGNIYYREHERKEKLRAGIQLPAGIVVIVSGVLAYYLTDFPFVEFNVFTGLFLVTISGMSFGIVWAVIFIILAYHGRKGYSYYYLSVPIEIKKFEQELKTYYRKKPTPNNEPEKNLRRFLVRQYIECATENASINDKKSAYLHKANKGLIIALVSLFISLIPFLMVYHTTAIIQKIEIIETEIGGEKMSNESGERAPEPPTPSNGRTSDIAKPEPPGIRIIKEGEVPPPRPKKEKE